MANNVVCAVQKYLGQPPGPGERGARLGGEFVATQAFVDSDVHEQVSSPR